MELGEIVRREDCRSDQSSRMLVDLSRADIQQLTSYTVTLRLPALKLPAQYRPHTNSSRLYDDDDLNEGDGELGPCINDRVDILRVPA